MNDLRTAAQQALEALEYGQYSLKQVSEHEWVSRGQLAMQALRAALAEPVQEQEQAEPMPPDTLCEELQRWCSNRKLYWRAPDAHGVKCSVEQAAELLVMALGVEVEIEPAQPAPAAPPETVQAEPVKLYCYIYEYDQGFGLHREFHPIPYNGMKPSRTVPVYAAPPKQEQAEPVLFIEQAHGIGEE